MAEKSDQFEPTRTAALERMSRFVPLAGSAYASERNYDRGPGNHRSVSTLSPYIRHRVLTESEVLQAVLARFSPSTAQKFVQEVYWRTYWKGWLEMRPSVWNAYQGGLHQALDHVQTQSGLRSEWEAACKGQTGIACFDAWAQELVTTGYLHNHARMWFASIWIFTLRLPWELGADLFLRHLLDGDPASNTLSWRWVAGLQTQGKNYLARVSNIAKYTEERFRPEPYTFDTQAAPLEGPPHPPRMDPPQNALFDASKPTAFVLHDDDLSPGFVFDQGLEPLATAVLNSGSVTPLQMAPQVAAFRAALAKDATARWSERLGPVTHLDTSEDLAQWAGALGAEQVVTAYAPVGPNADRVRRVQSIPVVQVLRPHDAKAWPHATAGFFKFKDKIPVLLAELRGLRAA